MYHHYRKQNGEVLSIGDVVKNVDSDDYYVIDAINENTLSLQRGFGANICKLYDQDPECYILIESSIKTQRSAKIIVPKDTEASNTRKLTLPTDSNARKNYPILGGCVRYFPAALAGVANISKLGNDKHNPGQPLHHARGKSMDHGDCILRHLIDTEDLLAAFKRGDTSVTKEQILIEVNQLAWRALAYSQELNEQFGAPLAPGAEKK